MNDIEKAIEFYKAKSYEYEEGGIRDRYTRLAISALEKQIPKKVDYSELNYSKLPVAKCPSCWNTTINDNRLLSSAKYCPDCGKKLDWEVEND